MNISQFNYIEVGLWFSISIGLSVQLIKQGLESKFGGLLAALATAFAIFAMSDVIEAGTGAWWRPWWLLLLKSACVGVFLLCFFWHKRIK